MLHAELAPLITKMIDKHAYDSIDIRDEVHKRLHNDWHGLHKHENINLHPAVLDICCGTGFSTMKNHQCVGIDNSIPMINKAINMHDKLDDINKPHFILSDAEYDATTYTGQLFDIVTCFFAFHEIPYDARNTILQNHLNNVNECIYIIDIDPNYKPSSLMKMGEPYINDYLYNVETQMMNFNAEKEILIKNHVVMWKINSIRK